MFKWYLGNYYSPEDSGGKGDELGDKSLDIGDMTKFLSEGDEGDEELPELEGEEGLDLKDTKDKDKKDKKDEKEEPELDIEDEPGDEDVALHEVPSLKAIEKKYPGILKDYPSLKSIYYREQQYSEIYPTVKDARASVEKVQQYDHLEESLLSGDMTEILTSVQEADKEAFANIADHFITMIGKVDQNAQGRIVGRIAKDIAIAMSKSDDENLKLAAQWMHKFMFNDSKISGYKLSEPKVANKDDRTIKQDEREQRFLQDQLDSAVNDVSTRVENLLVKSIDEVIDTSGKMTPYVRDKAIKDIIYELNEELNKDTRWKQFVNTAWEESGKKGFARSENDKIRNATLRKAKSLLPPIIRRVKAAALKGTNSRDVDYDRDDKPLPRGRAASSSKPTNSGNNNRGSRDAAPKIPRGTSTLDFLSSED